MAFVTREEMHTIIRETHLDSIVDSDDATVTATIGVAIAEIKTRLTPGKTKEWMDGRPHYDVEAIFSATGDDRNAFMVEAVKVITLWWLIVRANNGVYYEEVRQRYDRVMDLIKDLATGAANDGTLPVLPPPDPEEAPDTKPFRMGGNPKFHHSY